MSIFHLFGLPAAHVLAHVHQSSSRVASTQTQINPTADSTTIIVVATTTTMLSRQVATAGARVGASRGFSVLTAAEEFPG